MRSIQAAVTVLRIASSVAKSERTSSSTATTPLVAGSRARSRDRSVSHQLTAGSQPGRHRCSCIEAAAAPE